MMIRSPAHVLFLLTGIGLGNTATAQAAACLQDITVSEVGHVILDHGEHQERLVVLGITVADILFDGTEALSSAAHVAGLGQAGEYQLLSIAAYPPAFAAGLRESICGEDLLDVIDAYRLIGTDGDPMSGATGALSPSQQALSGLWRQTREAGLDADRIAAERAALAVIADFQARLPDRNGAFILNLRPEPPDLRDVAQMEARIAEITTDPTLTPQEMSDRLGEVFSGNAPASADPLAWLPCPCPMEVLEAHVLGPGGPPYTGESRSWEPRDAARVEFPAELSAIARNEDGSYRIEGRFEGGVIPMSPLPGAASGLAALTGVPDMVRGTEAQPLRGEFRIDRVLSGSLTDLPKVF
jgi:hypothetical protein